MAREMVKKSKWYEKYLPFVARSPEMQIRWLEAALRKGTLTMQELTPYITLLMEPEGEEHLETIRGHLAALDAHIIDKMLLAADVDDVPKLFRILPAPSLSQALAAITKEPPPFEKAPQLLIDRVFQAVYDRSEELLAEAAARVLADPGRTAQFREAYERFKEIKEDEKLLSALYPKAIVQ